MISLRCFPVIATRVFLGNLTKNCSGTSLRVHFAIHLKTTPTGSAAIFQGVFLEIPFQITCTNLCKKYPENYRKVESRENLLEELLKKFRGTKFREFLEHPGEKLWE